MKTTVRRRTGQPLTHLCYYKATALVWAHRTTDLFQHHSRVFRAAVDRLHRSLPRLTCLRTVELHLQPFNLGSTLVSSPSGMAPCGAGTFYIAPSGGDGHAYCWACHCMMMMMMIHRTDHCPVLCNKNGSVYSQLRKCE